METLASFQGLSRRLFWREEGQTHTSVRRVARSRRRDLQRGQQQGTTHTLRRSMSHSCCRRLEIPCEPRGYQEIIFDYKVAASLHGNLYSCCCCIQHEPPSRSPVAGASRTRFMSERRHREAGLCRSVRGVDGSRRSWLPACRHTQRCVEPGSRLVRTRLEAERSADRIVSSLSELPDPSSAQAGKISSPRFQAVVKSHSISARG